MKHMEYVFVWIGTAPEKSGVKEHLLDVEKVIIKSGQDILHVVQFEYGVWKVDIVDILSKQYELFILGNQRTQKDLRLFW